MHDAHGALGFIAVKHAEEHERLVLPHGLAPARGIGTEPNFHGVERHLVEGKVALVDQIAADRCVRVPVLAIIGDAQRRAIGQPDQPRTLNVQEEAIDSIFEPQQFQALAI